MPTSGSTRPPACALPARLRQSGGFTRLLSFHSLSKRSGLPGLRSGMVAGDAGADREIPRLPQCRGPHGADAAAGRLRRRLARRGPCRGQPRRLCREDGGGRTDPGQPDAPGRQGGFFLWLEVGNGEEFALRAWREQGVRVLPGAYMGREIAAGKNPVKPWLFLCPGGAC